MSALPDTDSYSNTNTDTDRIGWYYYVKNSVQWTDIDARTNSNADGTKIGMDKVGFNFTSVSQSVSVPVWLFCILQEYLSVSVQESILGSVNTPLHGGKILRERKIFQSCIKQI